MIQYKEKGKDQPSTRVSLYTYPALMAADILLYRPSRVPVGDDQRQHVELTRDLAVRFNNTYGAVFTVPEIVTPAAGARVMDLQDPTRKMSKSAAPGVDGGVIRLLDPPDVVRRKIARAVTDSETGPGAVRAVRLEAGRDEPARHPGRVRRLRGRPRDVRRPQGRRHRRGRRRAGADPEEVRRPRRRPGVRRRRLRRRSRALPRRSPPPSSPPPRPRWGCGERMRTRSSRVSLDVSSRCNASKVTGTTPEVSWPRAPRTPPRPSPGRPPRPAPRRPPPPTR